nr:uncharacterized protein LOC111414758 [Onthophagus taurus]
MVKYFVLLTFFVAVTTASPIANPKSEAKPSYYENQGHNFGYSQPIGHGHIGTQFPSVPISQPLSYSGISAASVSQVPYVSPQVSSQLSYIPSSYTGGASSYLQHGSVPYPGNVGGQYVPSSNGYHSGDIDTVPNFGGYNHAGYNPIQTIGHV